MSTNRYGLQTDEIEALINRCQALTPAEAEHLADVWRAAQKTDDWRDARFAAWVAIWDADRGADLLALLRHRIQLIDVHQSTDDRAATWAAVTDAAQALLARDLIGQSGFTKQHYDTLTYPWD